MSSSTRLSSPLGLFRISSLGHASRLMPLRPLRAVALAQEVGTRSVAEKVDSALVATEKMVLRRLEKAAVHDVPKALLRRCCAAAVTASRADAAAAGHGAIAFAADAAYAQLLDICRWREREGVDGILRDNVALATEAWYEDLTHYGIMPGCDRQGRAVMVQAIGRWDMQEMDDAASKYADAMVRGHIVVCEKLLRHAQDHARLSGSGDRFPGFVAVLDMQDVSARQNPMMFSNILTVLRQVSRINARYYPEAVEHVFVVNAPTLFRAIWKVLSPFVMPSSGTSLDVLKKGDMRKLVSECGQEVLPERLGGKLPASMMP